MSKRRGQGNQNQFNCGKRSRAALKKKHLYLVLDDWEEGFSIHKVDTDSLESDYGRRGSRHLPKPAALRIKKNALVEDEFDVFFTAMGSEIIIAANTRREEAPILVYDTKTAALSAGPCLPAQLLRCFNVTVAVGEVIYVLSSRRTDHNQWQHSFEAMSCSPKGWSWKKTVPSPPPFSSSRGEFVKCYAVHPDERTIFMTTRYWQRHEKGTYSFDTKQCMWRWRGEWALPFQGRAYFNSDLDAWVGLHEDGYICSCKVASCGSDSTELDWMMGKEKLFLKDPDKHFSATLACMGGNKFCLIESVLRAGLYLEERDCSVLQLTLFSLDYSKKGELETSIHCPTRSYLVSRYTNSSPLGAFWM